MIIKFNPDLKDCVTVFYGTDNISVMFGRFRMAITHL